MGLPAEQLARRGYRIHVARAYQPDHLRDFDVFVFCRPHLNPGVFEGLAACIRAQVPVIVDLDDVFHHIPPEHPGYPHVGPGNPAALRRLEQMVAGATLLTTSTPQVAEVYRRWSDQVRVIPNGWSRNNPAWEAAPTARDHIHLGWAGTITHRQDVLEMKSGVIRTLRAFPQAKLVIGGDPEVLRIFNAVPESQRVFLPPVSYTAYPRMLAEFDILLAPLENTAFNRAKSDIKLLDAGVRRIPWVASDMPAYREWGAGGTLVQKPNEWHRHLKSLVEDLALRKSLGRQGHEKALQRESSVLVEYWIEMLHELGFPPPDEATSEEPQDGSTSYQEDEDAVLFLKEVLASEDIPAFLQAHQARIDEQVIALVRRNAQRARSDGQGDLATGLSNLAQRMQDLVSVIRV
jgi:glycosyltransferase involved in cell wall biosynthesis